LSLIEQLILTNEKKILKLQEKVDQAPDDNVTKVNRWMTQIKDLTATNTELVLGAAAQQAQAQAAQTVIAINVSPLLPFSFIFPLSLSDPRTLFFFFSFLFSFPGKTCVGRSTGSVIQILTPNHESIHESIFESIDSSRLFLLLFVRLFGLPPTSTSSSSPRTFLGWPP